MPSFSFRIATAALCLSTWAAHATTTDPRGRWITASGNLEVDVAPCGEGALCGTATRVLANRSMSPGVDAMDPVDKRPALGMTILIDFRPDDDDASQWHGQIYNRENGKTYRCQMSLGPQGELVLRPYIGLPLFGKTQVWQRVQP
ncbi:MAG: DUF2147 domain-containing protein [Aquabacterium sp.]|uniref:DUF2147 domain-containing protein n=1 Tax=Aquabacterium sp. TaxID=1872578 RepID=UPI00271B4C1B|nr:DUF2147 domain-containing protein [Aquabacterium sp.]MDO9005608.1 DUF2147 domain-containing protein [Aquabacterium sp.]